MRKSLSQQRKEEKLLYAFFGSGGYTINKSGDITLNQLVGNDTVIIETPDVRRAFFSDDSVGNVLVVGKHKAIYLKSWQVLKVKYKNEDGQYVLTYLVRVTRNYLKPYHFSDYNIVDVDKNGGFSGFEENFSRSVNYDFLKYTAEKQNAGKRKYRLVA